MRTLRDIPEADARALHAAVELINKYPEFVTANCKSPDCCRNDMGHPVSCHRLFNLGLIYEEIR